MIICQHHDKMSYTIKYICTVWNGTLETNTNLNVTKPIWQYELYICLMVTSYLILVKRDASELTLLHKSSQTLKP